MADMNWNQLVKRSARLNEAQASDFGIFCAHLLRPLFVEFCSKCHWPFAEKFDQFLLNGRALRNSKALSEEEVSEIIPDTDQFEDLSVSYATYAGLALRSALFQPSGADSVHFVWSVVDLLDYNAGSKTAEHIFGIVDGAVGKLESGDDLGELTLEGFSWRPTAGPGDGSIVSALGAQMPTKEQSDGE